jgi:AcrR family transcriptional regulator
MTREVKKPEIRKHEILTTAQQFFFQKGYESTSIQDIIDELGIAKGTFYHYFHSKTDLLDQLMDSITDEMYAVLTPILQSDRTALDKLHAIFREGTAFKMTNAEVFIIMLKVMFKDENTVLRTKMYRKMVDKITPMYTDIIQQGIKEGTFTVSSSPSDTAEVLLQLGTNLNETVCRIMLGCSDSPECISELIQNKIIVYQNAMESILGAAAGSINLFQQTNFDEIVSMFCQQLTNTSDNDQDNLYQRGY